MTEDEQVEYRLDLFEKMLDQAIAEGNTPTIPLREVVIDETTDDDSPPCTPAPPQQEAIENDTSKKLYRNCENCLFDSIKTFINN